MKRQNKNTLIWLMFGIYLGTFIARALTNLEGTKILDWAFILAGIIVAILHYSPDKGD